jgi:hypothetical protein
MSVRTGHWPRVFAAVACVIAAPAARAHAQGERPKGIEITPYVGYRFGGDADGENASIDINDALSLGAQLDYTIRPGGRVGLFYTYQATSADVRSRVAGVESTSLDVDVHYLQFSGSNDLGKGRTARPFVSATIGGVYFDPKPEGSNGDWNVAGSVGLGLAGLPGNRVQPRAEVRALGTILSADRDVFCSLPGGCITSVDGEFVVQFDLSLGLAIAF